MISIEQLTFAYPPSDGIPGHIVFRGFDLTFGAQRITVVVGPSGCGKTTLLHLLAGLLPPQTGQVIFRDATIGEKLGFVFHAPSLLPWRTVLGNVLLGAEIRGLRSEHVVARAKALLQAYSLEALADSYPAALSAGMKQRVALIRALVSGARLLLLDEPLVNVDPPLRRRLEQDLSRAVDAQGITAILVTHDIETAVRLGDDIVVLGGTPTTVIEKLSVPIARSIRLDNPAPWPEQLVPITQRIWMSLNEPSAPAPRSGHGR